jgi:hypothetical protein
MSLAVIKFRVEGESVHKEGFFLLRGFQGKDGMGSEPVLHHLVDLTTPAFKSVGTDHKIDQAHAYIPAMAKGPCVGEPHFSDSIHFHFDGPCGADILTGSTRYASLGIDFKRGSNLLLRSPHGEANGFGSNDLIAGSNTEAAQDTIAFWGFCAKGTRLDSQFIGKTLKG